MILFEINMVLKNRLVFDVCILKSTILILTSEKLNSKCNSLSNVQFEPVLWQNEHFDS